VNKKDMQGFFAELSDLDKKNISWLIIILNH